MPRVWLSIGSNIDREKNIRGAVRVLRDVFGELVLSRVYESKAVGFEGAPFYNMVVGLDTDWPLAIINRYLREIELAHGRQRGGERFSSRTLDIDLLTYGEEVDETGLVDIPRKEITNCAFVLLPLSEVAGAERHPMDGRTYGELWKAFAQTGQPLWPVEFDSS